MVSLRQDTKDLVQENPDQNAIHLQTPKTVLFYLLSVLGFLCIVLAGMLSFRLLIDFHTQPPRRARQTNVELIQDWMTIPYLSRTYGVPQDVFVDKLKVNPADLRKNNIKNLAQKLGVQSTDLITSIKIIIHNFQTDHPTPPEPSPK